MERCQVVEDNPPTEDDAVRAAVGVGLRSCVTARPTLQTHRGSGQILLRWRIRSVAQQMTSPQSFSWEFT